MTLLPILLATGNPAKLARLTWLLEGLSLQLIHLDDLTRPAGTFDVVDENGQDFAANAALKAAAWSGRANGMLAIATDGGMRIPALGDNWDAVRTRRNAGHDVDDPRRIAHLLGLMHGLTGEDRHAEWHEAIAIARHGAALATWNDSGDGGYISADHTPSSADTAFWTESVRFYPAAGKLYRDFTRAERDTYDTVWPALRTVVRRFLRKLLAECP